MQWIGETQHGRSIPAPAGEPCCNLCFTSSIAVYPRACGGTGPPQIRDKCYDGLSPRLRGNRPRNVFSRSRYGSIPAPAGEPSLYNPAHEHPEVYPRACGGTLSPVHSVLLAKGLSPRLRGNRIGARLPKKAVRSIPAPAGEPRYGAGLSGPGGVYPRACGGTRPCGHPGSSDAGLSPRLRGNHPGGGVAVVGGGSIPAPAGEPSNGGHGSSQS